MIALKEELTPQLSGESNLGTMHAVKVGEDVITDRSYQRMLVDIDIKMYRQIDE